MKQFTPKKLIVYGKDGDRVEIILDGDEDMICEFHQNQDYYIDKLIVTDDKKMNININGIKDYNMTYYVKRTGKRYRKNRRGYR